MMKTLLLLIVLFQLAVLRNTRHHKKAKKNNRIKRRKQDYKQLSINDCNFEILKPKEGETVEDNTCMIAYVNGNDDNCITLGSIFFKEGGNLSDGKKVISGVKQVVFDPKNSENELWNYQYSQHEKPEESVKSMTALKIENCNDGKVDDFDLNGTKLHPAATSINGLSFMGRVNQMMENGSKKRRLRKRRHH